MTKIILLMWLADIVGNVGIVGGAALIVLCISSGIAIVGLWFVDAEGEIPGGAKRAWVYSKWLALVVAVACLFPNQSTLRLAAAGVAVGEVAKTATAQKAMDAFNATLDEIISKSKGKK